MRFIFTSFLLLLASQVAAKSDVILTKDNSVVFNAPFTDEYVAKVEQEIKDLDSRLASNDPIYLILSTPGGSIDAGLELISNLTALNRQVHTISLFSASMGFHTVQGLGSRLILENGTLMSHRAKGGFQGEFPGQLDTRYKHALRRVTRLDKKVVSRTKHKYTLEQYQALIAPEYWCDGQDCVDAGFADAVTHPKCDKSLDGTQEQTERFEFMGMRIELEVTRSKCPLITGILDYRVKVDNYYLYDYNKTGSPTYGPPSPLTDSGIGSYRSTASVDPERLFFLRQEIGKIISTLSNNRKEVVKY